MTEQELYDYLLVVVQAYDKNAPVAVQQATAVVCTLLASLKDGGIEQLSHLTGNFSAEAIRAFYARGELNDDYLYLWQTCLYARWDVLGLLLRAPQGQGEAVMNYLLWFDDSKKESAAKMADAIAAYQARFGVPPNVVICNEADRVPMREVLVRTEAYVRRNNFWIGEE